MVEVAKRSYVLERTPEKISEEIEHYEILITKTVLALWSRFQILHPLQAKQFKGIKDEYQRAEWVYKMIKSGFFKAKEEFITMIDLIRTYPFDFQGKLNISSYRLSNCAKYQNVFDRVINKHFLAYMNEVEKTQNGPLN